MWVGGWGGGRVHAYGCGCVRAGVGKRGCGCSVQVCVGGGGWVDACMWVYVADMLKRVRVCQWACFFMLVLCVLQTQQTQHRR